MSDFAEVSSWLFEHEVAKENNYSSLPSLDGVLGHCRFPFHILSGLLTVLETSSYLQGSKKGKEKGRGRGSGEGERGGGPDPLTFTCHVYFKQHIKS